MPNINDIYASGKYLKAIDLRGTVQRVTISGISSAVFEKGAKPILHFQGKEKVLVLNKTNALTIAETFGEEMNDWVGGDIELYVGKATFEGQLRDALRVRVPKQKMDTVSATMSQPKITMAPNARDRARAFAEAVPAPASDDNFLDEEIPF